MRPVEKRFAEWLKLDNLAAYARSIPLPRTHFRLTMQNLPGFRDFYPDDCARRNYIMSGWREVARRYGFVEYDGPVLESIELYEKKSGGELLAQLFEFLDKGGRHVALRPEMTPTLARMVSAREKDFKKPLRWFCCPQFFRYEKQQRGRCASSFSSTQTLSARHRRLPMRN